MQTIMWNPLRQLWETEQADLFSGRLEPYSETFATSGMTRNGQLFPLPQSVPHIDGNECSSLLPTPAAGNFNDGESPESWQARQATLKDGFGMPLAVAVKLLPTPNAAMERGSRTPQGIARRIAKGDKQFSLEDAAVMMYSTSSAEEDSTLNLTAMLPTPRATDGTKGGPNQRGSSGDLMLPSAVMEM